MRWERGDQEGKPGHLRAVAEALGIPPREAFEAIGWLPPSAAPDHPDEAWVVIAIQEAPAVDLLTELGRRLQLTPDVVAEEPSVDELRERIRASVDEHYGRHRQTQKRDTSES